MLLKLLPIISVIIYWLLILFILTDSVNSRMRTAPAAQHLIASNTIQERRAVIQPRQPQTSATAGALDSKWIPIRPSFAMRTTSSPLLATRLDPIDIVTTAYAPTLPPTTSLTTRPTFRPASPSSMKPSRSEKKKSTKQKKKKKRQRRRKTKFSRTKKRRQDSASEGTESPKMEGTNEGEMKEPESEMMAMGMEMVEEEMKGEEMLKPKPMNETNTEPEDEGKEEEEEEEKEEPNSDESGECDGYDNFLEDLGLMSYILDIGICIVGIISLIIGFFTQAYTYISVYKIAVPSTILWGLGEKNIEVPPLVQSIWDWLSFFDTLINIFILVPLGDQLNIAGLISEALTLSNFVISTVGTFSDIAEEYMELFLGVDPDDLFEGYGCSESAPFRELTEQVVKVLLAEFDYPYF